MASNHPIDRLFREGIGSSEIRPSANAWEQIQRQTAKKNKGLYLQIAASIALLCAIGVSTWWSLRVDQNPLANHDPIAITAPRQLAFQTVILPEKRLNPIPEVSDIKPQAMSIATVAEKHVVSKATSIALEVPVHNVTARGVVSIADIKLTIPQIDLEGGSAGKINIFYYAQATPGEVDASKKKLAKIIDYAKTTNPVDWVGDIRNKKDEWIDNVFSLDE